MNEERIYYKILTMIDIMSIFIIFLGLWKIDIAVSALLTSTIPTNGFLSFTPAQMYHLGIWGTVGSVFWLYLRVFGVFELKALKRYLNNK